MNNAQNQMLGRLSGCALIFSLLLGCATPPEAEQQTQATSTSAEHWLTGSESERWENTARHFRGLDQAMVETGYRYTELYWAGQDQNWDYAQYQLDKMRLSLELALERRPKRQASAAVFLQQELPAMATALETRDIQAFRPAFQALTQSCNACHQREQVAFFQVQTPTQRLSPLGGSPPPKPHQENTQ